MYLRIVMKKPSIQRVAFRYLNKKASSDFKEKLLVLLNSEDVSLIKQALVLNDTLGVFTDQEIAWFGIRLVIDYHTAVEEHWETSDGFGWFLLKKFPNNEAWERVFYLTAKGGNLKEIPKEIGNLTNLERLYLSNNSLTNLPKEIGNLKKLEWLYLDKNNLTSLPKEIGNLKNLTQLFLQNNKLTSIPKEIGNIKDLDLLNVSFNKLTGSSIPFESLSEYTIVWYKGNGIKKEDVPEKHRFTNHL